ncbi:MAG: hypothetical protein DHS20C13_24300 [Thermodesulfobacteriota bacterium]|nr:MAG: hypothetical protein DHS20C13_24300 [Thermodesulfobacteriota bacterium]
MRIILFSLAILFTTSFLALETFSQTDDNTNSKEAAVSEPNEIKSADDNNKEAESTLMHVPLQTAQFCQGKYNKKGIGGIEIITVQCPYVLDTCNCEVSKKNLRERVNCGGVTKNSSEGSELISCDSTIVAK